MMAVVELTREALDLADMAARRNRIVDAAFRTGGIIALGGTVYFGWWLYRYFTDVNISMKQSLGSVVEQEWPPLNPYLASQDCADQLWVLWGGAAREAELWNEIDVKMQKWNSLRSKIDSETGAFTGYSGEYAWAKSVERECVKAGIISRESTVPDHPVDRVANFVVGNKWYWGGVLALASLPPIELLGSEAKRMVTEHERERETGSRLDR